MIYKRENYIWMALGAMIVLALCIYFKGSGDVTKMVGVSPSSSTIITTSTKNNNIMMTPYH